MEQDQTVKRLVRIWPRLKGKIKRRVEREHSNMNDVLVAMLAAHYQIPYVRNQQSGIEVGPSDKILLALPPALADAIDTARGTETFRDAVVRVWCVELNEKFKPGGRWPRKAAAA